MVSKGVLTRGAAMADYGKSVPEKHGLAYFIYKLFHRNAKISEHNDEIQVKDNFHLEPKYWPEVIEFMNNLNQVIETHTISGSNVQHVNQRIIDYVAEQINVKGQVEDVDKKYSALDTLADRILSNTFSKIAGLKHEENTHADFTDIVLQFKKRLHQRYQDEVIYLDSKKQNHESQNPLGH